MESIVLNDLFNWNMEEQDSNSDDLTLGSVPCRLHYRCLIPYTVTQNRREISYELVSKLFGSKLKY